jgi:hypothetical protein
VSRQTSAIGKPAGDLSGFPAFDYPEGTSLYRAVSAGNGPWWFSSSMNSRFDLAAPDGTCYLGVTMEAAIRERGGKRMLTLGYVNSGFVTAMNVVQLKLPAPVRAAAVASPDAVKFGCNRELSTISDYDLTQTWAAAFHRAGFGGIAYPSRFTSILEANAFALFGASGEQKHRVAKTFTGTEAMAAAGLSDLVDPVVMRAHATIVDPGA